MSPVPLALFWRALDREGEGVLRAVLPHAPDDLDRRGETKVGYEFPFNRHFYVFEPPRPLEEIDADLKQVTGRILKMIGGLSA